MVFRDACATWFDSTRILKRLLSIPQNGEVCTVDASGCSFSQRGSHVGKSRSFFDSLRQFSLCAAFFGLMPIHP